VEAQRLLSVKGNDQITVLRTSASLPVTITQTNGFNNTAKDLELIFQLSNTQIYIGGALFSNVALPGASDIINFFQQYRIDMVEIQMTFSHNSSETGSSNNLPTIAIAADFSDFNGSATTFNTLLQYEDIRVFQLGNLRTSDGLVYRVKPVVQTTSSGIEAGQSGVWQSVLNPVNNMAGVKMAYDNQGATGTTSIGTLNFYFRYHISCRRSN